MAKDKQQYTNQIVVLMKESGRTFSRAKGTQPPKNGNLTIGNEKLTLLL